MSARELAQGLSNRHVTCPNGHYLQKFDKWRYNWGCDSGAYKDPENVVPYRSRVKKSQYGLPEEEEWRCERGCTSLYEMADVPGYRCGRCDFFLCDRCHERAENHLKMTEEIDKTLKDTAKVEWMQSKLMVVGEGAAGKTSTVRTLLGLKFNKNWDSTVGANLTQATAGEDGEHAWGEVGEDEKIDHVIKAAVQQMDEKQIPKSSFKKRLPFGRNLVRFFREQRKLHAEQRKMLREMERIEKNMTEEEREELERVRRAQRQARAPKREKGEGLKLDAAAVAGKLTMESVQKANEKKDLIQFTIWDYGGQTVFYSLHHMFLTKYGIYLVVFNLHSLLGKKKDTTQEFLQFWMNSIKLHAAEAPILLIATHIDRVKKLNEAVKDTDQHLSTAFADCNLVKSDTTGMSFFPLDNRSSKGITDIRHMIEVASRKQDFLYNKVSIRWLRCLDLLLEQQRTSWISMVEVRKLSAEAEVTTELEIESMLRYFNEVGVVLYFDSTVALRQLIIVNPQWLIDKLGQVIRDDSIHHFDMKSLTEVGLAEDVEQLFKNALASRDLLEFLWDKQVTDFLIDLMRRTMLLSDWTFDNENDVHYMIPSLLKKSKNLPKRGVILKYDFSASFLPRGCFERLVCLCVDYAVAVKCEQAPEIFTDAAVIKLADDVTITLDLQPEAIQINIDPLTAGIKFRKIFNSMFQKLNTDSMSGGLTWVVFYEDEMGQLVTEDEAGRDKLTTWFEPRVPMDANKEETHGLDLEAFMEQIA